MAEKFYSIQYKHCDQTWEKVKTRKSNDKCPGCGQQAPPFYSEEIEQPKAYYLIPYKFIVKDYEADCSIILTFDTAQYGTYLFDHINKYFDNLYGDGECDRDGCVFFYDAGALCIQLKMHKEIPVGIAMWHKNNGGIPIIHIKTE